MSDTQENSKIHLAIVGYRHFNDYALLCREIDAWRSAQPGVVVEIISGGATGADRLAERYAKDNRLALCIYPADWKQYGKSAGPRRNAQIVQRSTHIIAFLHTDSIGTRNTIELAFKAKKPVKVVEII